MRKKQGPVTRSEMSHMRLEESFKWQKVGKENDKKKLLQDIINADSLMSGRVLTRSMAGSTGFSKVSSFERSVKMTLKNDIHFKRGKGLSPFLVERKQMTFVRNTSMFLMVVDGTHLNLNAFKGATNSLQNSEGLSSPQPTFVNLQYSMLDFGKSLCISREQSKNGLSTICRHYLQEIERRKTKASSPGESKDHVEEESHELANDYLGSVPTTQNNTTSAKNEVTAEEFFRRLHLIAKRDLKTNLVNDTEDLRHIQQENPVDVTPNLADLALNNLNVSVTPDEGLSQSLHPLAKQDVTTKLVDDTKDRSHIPLEDTVDVKPNMEDLALDAFNRFDTPTEGVSHFCATKPIKCEFESEHRSSFSRTHKTQATLQSHTKSCKIRVENTTASKQPRRIRINALPDTLRRTKRLYRAYLEGGRCNKRGRRQTFQERKVFHRAVTRSVTAFFRQMQAERAHLQKEVKNVPNIILTRSMVQHLNVKPKMSRNSTSAKSKRRTVRRTNEQAAGQLQVDTSSVHQSQASNNANANNIVSSNPSERADEDVCPRILKAIHLKPSEGADEVVSSRVLQASHLNPIEKADEVVNSRVFKDNDLPDYQSMLPGHDTSRSQEIKIRKFGNKVTTGQNSRQKRSRTKAVGQGPRSNRVPNSVFLEPKGVRRSERIRNQRRSKLLAKANAH